MFLPCLNISGCLENCVFLIFPQIQPRADSLVQGLCSNRNGGSRPGLFLLRTLEQPPEQQREMPKCWKTSQPFVEGSCRKHKLLVARALPVQYPFCLQQLTWKTLSQATNYHCAGAELAPSVPSVSLSLWNRLQGSLLVSKYQSPRAGTPHQGNRDTSNGCW